MTRSVFELPTTKMFGLVGVPSRMKGCSSRHQTMNDVKDQEWFGNSRSSAPAAEEPLRQPGQRRHLNENPPWSIRNLRPFVTLMAFGSAAIDVLRGVRRHYE